MSNLRRVELHPATIKMIKKGHPWVTLDKFSQNFPKGYPILIGTDSKNKPICELINDPEHPKIKARLWRIILDDHDKSDFIDDLRTRIQTAIQFRDHIREAKERENYYLIFGEADYLPGLFVQYLNKNIFIQYKSTFWAKYTDYIIKFLKSNIKEKNLIFWLQERKNNKKGSLKIIEPEGAKNVFDLNEYGVNYKIKLHETFDPGIYTDMTAVRKSLSEIFKKSKNVLNLYSYTGAYSLYALKNGADQVTSVDLSKPYLNWLDENLSLNEDIDPSKHQSLCMSVQDALKQFNKYDSALFDLIICDPPSSSNDGKNVTQAFKEYDHLVKQLVFLTRPGGHLILFLNTHSVSRQKFETKIKELIGKKAKIIPQKISLTEDCPTIKGYPEGDYLKGVLIQKK